MRKEMKKVLIIFALIVEFSGFAKAQWEACNTGLNTIQSKNVFALCFKGANLFAGTNDGIFVSTDNGLTWSARNNGNNLQGTWSLGVKGDLILAGGWGGVYISKDDGLTWTHKGNGIVDSVAKAFAFLNDNIYIGTDDNSDGGSIYMSSDDCETWTIKELGPSFTRLASLIVKDNLLFASVNAAFGNYGVLLSKDYGDTWEFKNNNIYSNDLVKNLIYDETNLYLGSYGQYGGVYLSSDNGDNWKLMDNGLKEENKDTKVSVLFNAGKILLVGMSADGGIFISSDKANSWHPRNNGLTNMTIKSFAMNKDYIFVGTYGGVFRAKKDDLTDIEESQNSSNSVITLYPNPATDNLSINCSKPELSGLNIAVCNSLGIVLINKTMEGSSISISTEDLPSGIYFCTINTGKDKFTKSFVVIR